MRYTQNFVLMSAISAIVLALGGCASIRSISLSPGINDVPPQGGMVYYLPMQRLKLTLTVVAASDAKQNPTRTVEVSPTAILADTGARYVAIRLVPTCSQYPRMPTDCCPARPEAVRRRMLLNFLAKSHQTPT
jgi:hypothetical protein